MAIESVNNQQEKTKNNSAILDQRALGDVLDNLGNLVNNATFISHGIFGLFECPSMLTAEDKEGALQALYDLREKLGEVRDDLQGCIQS